MDIFKNKIILVTGGAGTIGSALVERLLSYNPKQIRVLSLSEGGQYELMERLGYPKNLRLFIGDIRDRDRLYLAFRKVDIVFHAAALKHVPFCEYNPFEAVKTNVIGSQNIIDAALMTGVKRVIGISTDKVVDPSSVMGISKLMMEKLLTNANYYKGDIQTEFSCVRFGNVTWASGSVLPLWERQAKQNGAIRVTDDKMTRFMMSQKQAVGLVLQAAQLMKGGEVFILKMPSVRMIDLAHGFLKKYFPKKEISIDIVGARPGEKLHEALLGDTGNSHVLENKEMFIQIPQIFVYSRPKKKPDIYRGFTPTHTQNNYSSENHLDTKKVLSII